MWCSGQPFLNVCLEVTHFIFWMIKNCHCLGPGSMTCAAWSMHEVGTSRPSWPRSWPWPNATHFCHLRQRSNSLHSRDSDGRIQGSLIGWNELGQMIHTWSSNMFVCAIAWRKPMPLIQKGGVRSLHIEFKRSLFPCRCSQWENWSCGQACFALFSISFQAHDTSNFYMYSKFWSISLTHHQRIA